MERPNNFETNHESGSDSKVNFMKSILRMAPVLASVLAMSACGGDKELDKCQIEVAGLQGALEGVGVKHEAPKVDDLQACKIEKSKLDGIMEGWKLTHPEIINKQNGGYGPAPEGAPSGATFLPGDFGPEPTPAVSPAAESEEIKSVKPYINDRIPLENDPE